MRKSIWIVSSILVVLAILIAVTYKIVESRAQKLPANSPEICNTQSFAENLQSNTSSSMHEQDLPERVVLIGDSITHGTVSFNYIDYLIKQQEAKGLQKFTYINAGVNSHLAYNVVQRLPAILACQPDYAIILIGTNDVNARLSARRKERYIETMQLPRTPDLDWYRTNLTKIIRSLQQNGQTRIALLSLPVLGEDLDSRANHLVQKYSRTIKAVAQQHGVAYLPLHERQRAFLLQQKHRVKLCQGEPPVEQAVARHFLLGQSFDEIAASQGFHLTTDCLHMNRAGGVMIAELIQNFL